MDRELAAYRVESNDKSKRIVNDIQQTFDTTYRAVRTIARLPAVQGIDWDETRQTMDRKGVILDENTRLTVQEIYNALAIDVDVSELYIVSVNLDPDGLDPLQLAPREPLITFDEFIVGRTGASPESESHHDEVDIEEIEIFEYRLMRTQLDWLQDQYPTSARVVALEYPALTGPPVVTCDNSQFDPSAPDDADRSGIILSVPIFNADGVLKGCVSAILLTHTLSGLLPSGDYAILSNANEIVVPPTMPGQWDLSNADGVPPEPDSSLLFSVVADIPTADRGGDWFLWAGFPDDKYWSRNDVNATLQARSIGFAAVAILALGATSGTMLVLGAYKRLATVNAGLEKTISLRTSDLMLSRDAAILSLSREKDAMAEKDRAMAILEVMASTDKLTGLPNRTLFVDRLQQAITGSRRSRELFAVLFFDFDRFKVVNDSLGHDIGDALLCNIATIFRRELREDDTIARFGGDEFVVLLRNLAEWPNAFTRAERLLAAFAQPHLIDDNVIVSTASIGIVTNQYSYASPSEMIRDADAAMYQAKENGKNQFVVFDKAMHANALNRLRIESDLRSTVENDEFRLVYQPIVDLNTGKLKGFEALIRWDHPTRGLVRPDEFIDIAEDTGLIKQIGKWVLWTAAAQIAEWNKRFGLHPNLSININVSKRQILDPSFLADVLACQRKFDLFDAQLQLEITESVIVDSCSDIIPLLNEIRSHEIHIVMDDFGTGVSSLSTLHAFPIDVLKIDQTFIRALSSDRSLLAVVSSITNLAENLGIRTVAEGIESSDVIVALQSIGSTWGQGYYFAKPLSIDAAEKFIMTNLQQSKNAA